MSGCPKCRNEDEIKLIAKYYTNFDLEIQMICGKCGNVFREKLFSDDSIYY